MPSIDDLAPGGLELPPQEAMKRAAELQRKVFRANFALAVLANDGIQELAISTRDGSNSAKEAMKFAAQEVCSFLKEQLK